jgi:CelD/BcsL family acetyltransferase involved in cellulose biosynthesis
MSALETEIIRDPATLAALVPDWWSLWRRVPQTTPFQSPAWLMPWWDVFATGQLASVAVRDGQSLVALAPLYLESGPLGLRILPLGVGLSDYCDLIIDPEHEEAADALMSAIGRIGPWEIFEMTELPPQASTLKLPTNSSVKAMSLNASLTPILVLPDHAANIDDALPAESLRQLRRAKNAASKHGEIAVVVGDADNSEALLQDLIRLHTACSKSRRQPGSFADKHVGEFHAAALPGLIAANLARVYALMLGDATVALYYGFLDRDRAYAYLQGHDPEYWRESPGVILLAHAIEQAMKEGVREFHLPRGDEVDKFEWGASRHTNQLRLFTREDSLAAI